MEVEIRQWVCNNSPAEWTSPENEWRLNDYKDIYLYFSRKERATMKSRLR